jgi:hypothetical protein
LKATTAGSSGEGLQSRERVRASMLAQRISCGLTIVLNATSPRSGAIRRNVRRAHGQLSSGRHRGPARESGLMPESLIRKKTSPIAVRLAGFKSVWWPASSRNGGDFKSEAGRLHVATPAGLNPNPHSSEHSKATIRRRRSCIAGFHRCRSGVNSDRMMQAR